MNNRQTLPKQLNLVRNGLLPEGMKHLTLFSGALYIIEVGNVVAGGR